MGILPYTAMTYGLTAVISLLVVAIIVAYASTAIPSTLGGSGALAKEKDPVFVGELMHRILSDEQLKAQLIAGQKERLKDFSYEKISAQLIAYLQTFLGRETR